MTRKRAFLSLLILAGLTLGPALPAQAATKAVKVPGTNWFWERQQRPAPSDLGVECPSGAPACPDQRAPGFNPHQLGALPVQLVQGEDEKVSAIQFDMSILPAQGATITRFTFSVIESQDPQDRAQTVDVGESAIQACLITQDWPESLEAGADELKNAPEYSASCVDGKRIDTATPPRWDFDATSIVTPWGEAPASAFGLMLVGKKGGDENWQIVLKGPRRDDSNTPDNESKTNANNIKATMVFTPKPAPSFAGFTGFPSSSDGFGFGNASDFGTTPGSTFPAGTAPTPAPVPGTAPTAAQGAAGAEDAPVMPWYFWLLIPSGLMGLSLVRHIVLEPLPGKRADGVVALIRRHNAARLGRPPSSDGAGALVALSGALRSTGMRIRSLARRVVTGGKKR